MGAWDAINAERSPYFGVVVHKRLFGINLRWTARRESVYSHWRNHIVASLYDRVVEEDIEVVFGARLESIDFESRVCQLADGTELEYDLLLGADGMHSQTRSLMAMDHPEHPPTPLPPRCSTAGMPTESRPLAQLTSAMATQATASCSTFILTTKRTLQMRSSAQSLWR